MSLRRPSRLLAAALFASAAAVAWKGSGPGSTALEGCSEKTVGKPIVDAGDSITLAFMGSLTGSEGAVGQPLKNAIKVAEWQINAAGGLLGKRIVFRIEDDATDKEKASRLADDLIAARIPAVIGPTASPQAALVTPKLRAAKIIDISSTVTLTSLTTDEPPMQRFFFRTVPPADVQGRVTANFAFRGPTPGDGGAPTPCRNMALAKADDAYGNSYGDGVAGKFVGLGGTIVGTVKFPTDPKATYEPEILQIIAMTPRVECISLVAFGPAGAQFMRDYKKVIATDTSRDWSKFFVVGSNALYTTTFVNNARTNPSDPASPSATEGIYGVLIDPTPDTANYNAFKRMYLAQFPLAAGQTAVPRNTANTFDAAILLALAIEAAGGVDDPVKVRDKLFEVSKEGEAFGPDRLPEAIEAIARGQNVDYNGASGNVDFDEFGNVTEDFIIWRVIKGQLTPIEKVKAADTF
jgi:ABC-type branched-subunit amino acid transport system substrate-binding protein